MIAAPRLLDANGKPLRLDPDLDAPLVGPSMLALVGTLAPACNAWRVWQPFASLKLRGYPAEWGWYGDPRLAPHLPRYDAYLLCRAMWTRDRWKGALGWFRSSRALGKKIFYETDDDIFSVFMIDQQLKGIQRGTDPEVLKREIEGQVWTLQQCDGVTVTTQRLATIARQYTSKPVVVVPNAIDAEWFAAVQATAQRTVPGLTIGWAGGNRPDGDVAAMAEAWGRIARRYPKVTFVVAGHQPAVISEHVPETRLRRLPWREVHEYPVGLVNIDVGCCPLEDKPFNRAKTPIKAWEYALSGAAVVASPTVYRQCIEPAGNGYLATTADEWEQHLSFLVEHEEGRRHLADTLKADVLEQWSLRKNYWRWPAAWTRLWRGEG